MILKFKGRRGITLIALVITIVVLLILAGVGITAFMGENGIIIRTMLSKEETEKNNMEEAIDLILLEWQTERYKNNLVLNDFLDSKLNLKTDEISLALNRGKHTTRHTELFDLLGGYIVDTPGFSSVDFREMSEEDIRDNMREMFDNLHYCKYRDCMHIKEDGCKVKELVLKCEILSSRYDNYKSFIESKKMRF